MTVRRMSISLPPQTEERIRAAAAAAGVSVSTWVVRAAEDAALIEDGRRAVREFESEHGALPAEERRRARQVLAEHGLVDGLVDDLDDDDIREAS